MGKIIDITGQVFGKLTVLEKRGQNERSESLWLCKCECGKEVIIRGRGLRSGNANTCGYCLRCKRNYKHGGYKTLAYKSWTSMKYRCYEPTNNRYKDYGGRGIQVCDRWLNSFENFLADMGERPSTDYSLDRIDVNGNYEPSNCRWITKMAQMSNKRRSPKNRK